MQIQPLLRPLEKFESRDFLIAPGELSLADQTVLPQAGDQGSPNGGPQRRARTHGVSGVRVRQHDDRPLMRGVVEIGLDNPDERRLRIRR